MTYLNKASIIKFYSCPMSTEYCEGVTLMGTKIK